MIICFVGVVGAAAGMIVAQTLTGYLCSLHFLGGWPSSFYIFGECNNFLKLTYMDSECERYQSL